MVTKNKKKNIWPWIVLIVVGLLIIASVGLAVIFALIGQVTSKQSASQSVDYYDEGEYRSSETSVLGEAVEEKSLSPQAYESDEAEDVSSIDTAAGEVSENKVIKTGSMRIEVEKIEESTAEITSIAQANGGFVQNANTWTDTDGDQSGSITIKVPADKFENVFDVIKDLAINIESENVSGQDVTEQYVDLQAQLKNYRAEEEQYLNILDKAETVDDILKVTRQLSIVRGNIESIEGRLKYLDSVTDFSTITVYLSQELQVEVPTSKWRPLNNLKTAFSYWVKSLQWILDAAVWVLIFLGPVLIVIWLIVWGIRKKVKK